MGTGIEIWDFGGLDAFSQVLKNATLDTAVAKGTWTASGTWTIPAVTLGGTVDANSQKINNALVPWARVYHSAAETTTSGAWYVLAFNTERYDTDTIHDTVTNNSRLTCKTAGRYLIIGNVEFVGNATGQRDLRILLNAAGTVIDRTRQAGTTVGNILRVATIYDLAVNDYVVLSIFQNSGGNLDTAIEAQQSPEFMMIRIGA